jgi:hypothetical protein
VPFAIELGNIKSSSWTRISSYVCRLASISTPLILESLTLSSVNCEPEWISVFSMVWPVAIDVLAGTQIAECI